MTTNTKTSGRARAMGNRTYKHWSLQEIETLRTLAASGMSNDQIAELMMRTTSSIKDARKRHNASRKFMRWTPAQRSEIKALKDKGLTDEEIGARYGVTGGAVFLMRLRYSITAGEGYDQQDKRTRAARKRSATLAEKLTAARREAEDANGYPPKQYTPTID